MQNQTTAFPWLRRIKVTLSGLSGTPTMRILESDGTRNTLRIGAHIEKSVKNRGAISSLIFYNLSRETRSSFVRDKTLVIVEAGWDDGPNAGRATIFRGNFLTSQTQRHGPDLVTTIYAQSARDALATTPAIKSWGAGTPVETVLKDIANSLDNVKYDRKMVVGINRKIGTGGFSVSGSAETVLDQIGRQFGFDWVVNDHQFLAVDKRKAVERITDIASPTLLQVSPVFAGVRRYRRGITGSCMFKPELVPGQTIRIKSTVDPGSDGEYRLQELAHDLDCYASASFTTHFQGITNVIKN